VWRPAQVEAALAQAGCAEHAAMTLQALGLDRSANFRDPHHPEEPATWVLTLEARPEVLAARAGCFEGPWWQAFDRARSAMLAARSTRPQPFRDDAVIAAWNGLAIEGLAEAGVALARPELVKAAASAATFVLERLRTHEGAPARSWRNGSVSGPAFLEDLGCMALGLLALHRADPVDSWRTAAERLLELAWSGCWSPDHGWTEAPADAAGRFVAVGGVDDGAVPSGAGAATLAMVMLAEQGGEACWIDRAFKALDRASGVIAERPTSSPLSLLAAVRLRALDERVPGGSTGGPVQARLEARDREGLRFELRLHVKAGHHIQGRLPAGETSLQVEPRDAGVRIEVRWPEKANLEAGTLSGEILVPITLLEPCPAPRPLRLRVRWQCCQDGPLGACMPPEQALLEA
jgi:uncharacterized protein YyaL (SSP411 family)